MSKDLKTNKTTEHEEGSYVLEDDIETLIAEINSKKHSDVSDEEEEVLSKKAKKKKGKKEKKYKYSSPKRVVLICLISVVVVLGLTLFAFKKYFHIEDKLQPGDVFREQVETVVKKYSQEPLEYAKEYLDEVTATNSILEVDFIDAGQGDSILIQCEGETMLIDASLDEYGTYIQNYLLKKGIHQLDYVVITHYDWDHVGGMDVILQKFDCINVFLPPYVTDTKSYRDVLLAMSAKNYRGKEPLPGTTFKLGDANVQIIGPTSYKTDNENDLSTIVMVYHGDNRFLFTGDAEFDEEQSLINGNYDLSADVLKLGHHGSKTSSCEEFLQAVNPEYAVISCGQDNPYGHPHESTLERLKRLNIKVFRTDEQGAVVAVSNGQDIFWNTEPSTTWKPGVKPDKSKGKKSK